MRPPSLKAADFQRALGARPASRTAHFALHVLFRATEIEGGKQTAVPSSAISTAVELSTGDTAAQEGLVDDSFEPLSFLPGHAAWRLGLVLPKKQARRSVTRSLIRHQARASLHRHADALAAAGRFADVDGWVLRLRAPFDRQTFPSAASDALKNAVRVELEALWRDVLTPSRHPQGKGHGPSHASSSSRKKPGGAA
ncbi:MAG: ribonuclease P protein component [Aquabacterium sp.]